MGPDEPRYAWIARDMAESGDWVTPRLYGKPWFEKPVLYYWGAAASFKLFGVNEAAARLPSALSALMATLALSWLAWRIYGGETARWLLLLLPTSAGMIGFSHAAATDMPFSGMLCVAMVCAAVVLRLDRAEAQPEPARTPWLALVLFGFFLGAAVLAKGPAAMVLSGGGVFFWALCTKRWRDAFRLFHPAAIATLVVTALPWYVLCARRNPEFLRVFIIEHNFKRYLTPEFQHIQPFWFYVPVLLVAFLPWIGILLWTVVAGSSRAFKYKKISDAMVFFLIWAGFCFVFFSISKSKLPGYILPAIPAIALVLARSCASLAVEKAKSFGITIGIFAILFYGASELLSGLHFHFGASGVQLVLALVRMLGMLALANGLISAGYLFFKNHWPRTFTISMCVIPVLFLVLVVDKWDAGVAPFSSRDLAEQLIAHHIPPDKSFIHNGISRGMHLGLNFYMRREIPDWNLNPDSEAYVISGGHSCEGLRKDGFDCTEILLESPASGWFVSHVTPKALENGTTHGGKSP